MMYISLNTEIGLKIFNKTWFKKNKQKTFITLVGSVSVRHSIRMKLWEIFSKILFVYVIF